jgi:hypothetical protein
MTQTPHDQLAKQYLEEFLAPFGVVQRQYEVPGEAKFIDVWFVPDVAAMPMTSGRSETIDDLGLLGQMMQKPCLFEPYRNVPSRTDVRVGVMKLVWVQEDERRKAQKDEVAEADQPVLWILAATISQPLLQAANVLTQPNWPSGVYFMGDLLKTAIVVIDELPVTSETLLLRVLGRGETQTRAIREVLALPIELPKRGTVLRLLASWKVRMDVGELIDFAQQEEFMALSEAFLTWEREAEGRWQREGWQKGEQEGRQKGEQEGRQEEKVEIALNMLRKNLDLATIAEVTGLTIEQLQSLSQQS